MQRAFLELLILKLRTPANEGFDGGLVEFFRLIVFLYLFGNPFPWFVIPCINRLTPHGIFVFQSFQSQIVHQTLVFQYRAGNGFLGKPDVGLHLIGRGRLQ